jgi:hypothetical protein
MQSCVTEVTLEDEDKKFFAVCELRAGEPVRATVKNTGNTGDLSPLDLHKPDSLKMTLGIGNTDEARDFVYQPRTKDFGIDPKFVPQAGVSYRLAGLSNFKIGEPDATLVMPVPVVVSEAKAQIAESTDKFKTIEVNIRVAPPTTLPAFFYLEPKVAGKNIETEFVKDITAYKPLNHKDGFLVDHSRIKNNTIKLHLIIPANQDVKTIESEISNVTPTYYYYNIYKSDLVSPVNSTSIVPTIVGDAFNIRSSTTYGSFSAITPSYISVEVR